MVDTEKRSTTRKQVATQLTPELEQEIKDLAARERRSVSSMIAILLEDAIAARRGAR